MPIYEYLCERGHRFDVLQRMTDEPVATCEVCGTPVQRVLHPVAVHFKGSGFYTTDYGRGKGVRDGAKAEGEGAKPAESGSKNGAASDKAATGTSPSSSESSGSRATSKE
jgi:putative FmdB family regulatory protein